MDILPGLLTIITMHFLGVISPGPDFALVVKNALTKSRQHALATSLGVSSGLMIHISYCIFGLDLLLNNSPKTFKIIKTIGGIYLLYLSIQSLRAARAHQQDPKLHAQQAQTLFKAFLEGFVCNLLNVKAILFILFLFSIVIEPATTHLLKTFYGVIMVLITLSWFVALSFLISIPKFKQQLFKSQALIHVLFGAILGSLGIFVLAS